MACRSSISVVIIGKHDADVAQDAGAHDGAKLALEHGDVVQAHADGAVAEEGVALRVDGLGLGVFVGAEIEGADDQRAVLEAKQGIGVGAVMLLLAGFVVAGEVEEFGAVQADALGAAAKGIVDLGGEFDVGHEADEMPVEGLGGQILEHGAIGFDLQAMDFGARGVPRVTCSSGLMMTTP